MEETGAKKEDENFILFYFLFEIEANGTLKVGCVISTFERRKRIKRCN